MSNPQNSQGPKRLPTHRQNRDLTLGGSTSSGQLLFQPKRTFVPNFNAKKKTSETTSNDSSENVKIQSNNKPNKFRDSRKSAPSNQNEKKSERPPKAQYVQSYSMFAQGAGAVANTSAVGISNRPSSGSGHLTTTHFHDNESKSTSTSHATPGVVFKKEAKSDPDKNCFIADLKSGLYPPIKLPFEAPIKSESKLNVSSSGDPANLYSQFSNPVTSDFLFGNSSEGKLFSLQLPKVLPSPSAVTYASRLCQNTQSSSPETTNVHEDNGLDKPEMDLSSFPEGKIGKLQLLRNGKVRLVIGECSFDVDYGFSNPHLVDLAMFTPPPSNSDQFGELSILGHINHKVIVRPRIDDLIKAKYSQGLKDSRIYDLVDKDSSESEVSRQTNLNNNSGASCKQFS